MHMHVMTLMIMFDDLLRQKWLLQYWWNARCMIIKLGFEDDGDEADDDCDGDDDYCNDVIRSRHSIYTSLASEESSVKSK